MFVKFRAYRFATMSDALAPSPSSWARRKFLRFARGNLHWATRRRRLAVVVHQPECPLSSGYPDFLGSFLDLSNPGIDLVLSDRTHGMINDDRLKVRHAKSLSG